MDFRWIKRDGGKVLQQKIMKPTYFSGGMPFGTVFDFIWEDVPVVEAEPGNKCSVCAFRPGREREKVCDELINIFNSTGDWETSHIIRIINKIRDRK